MSTCSVPSTDKAGSACVTSASVLCCQLQVHGGVGTPIPQRKLPRKERCSHPGGCRGAGRSRGRPGQRGRWEHRTPWGGKGSVPQPGQAVSTHVRLLPGSWRLSQAGGQATAISSPCSSLTLENGAGSKPQRPASRVSQREQGRARPAHPAPTLAWGARGSSGLPRSPDLQLGWV